MTDGIRNFYSFLEPILGGHQLVAVVVRNQIALFTNEEDAAFPFDGKVGREDVWSGLTAAVIPGEREWRAAGLDGGVLVADNEPRRSGIRIAFGAFSFGAERSLEAESPVRQVHVMAAEIAEGAAAEMPPIAPGFWNPLGRVGPGLNGAEPEVVMQGRGWFCDGCGAVSRPPSTFRTRRS